MKNANAVFYKQFNDTLKNPATLFQFIIYPLFAFLMTRMIDFEAMMDMEQYINVEAMGELASYIDFEAIRMMAMANVPNMITMQAVIFAGMALIPIMGGIIAEDSEKKSLSFLMMAGVKPSSYLLGICSVVFILSFFASVAFSLIGGFSGLNFWIFTASMMSSVTASIVLGATFGIIMKNQQAVSGLVMPAAFILGFGPIFAQFNDRIARVLHIFYTQQLNVVADYLTTGDVTTPLWQSFVIMWANVAVLVILFVIAYTKKGLKD